jgi:hypothetical protein
LTTIFDGPVTKYCRTPAHGLDLALFSVVGATNFQNEKEAYINEEQTIDCDSHCAVRELYHRMFVERSRRAGARVVEAVQAPPCELMTKVKISLKDLGSGALPRVPRPEDLSCDLVWIRSRNRFELLQPTREAICQVQITRVDPL